MSEPIDTILIANRGEIAVRIARAATELGLRSVAVFSDDDAHALHRRVADADHPLGLAGAAAYLDIDRILAAAREHACRAVHPGYGFLSENADFARRCAQAGLVFIGPSPEVLDLFGDKVRARDVARAHDVPVAAGTAGPVTLDEARAFMDGLGEGAAVMIKAVAGGGGRGMRRVEHPDQLADAYARCRSEARAAFGRDEVYVEALIRHARHIEVQIVGDGRTVVALGERDCSVQRRHQKIVEIAPSPSLSQAMRMQLAQAATRMAGAVAYRGVGTFEFLVDADTDRFVFMEANPRIQVEHTVTEAVMGVDLVQCQIRLAQGATLADVGLHPDHLPTPRGMALQLRINMEAPGPAVGATGAAPGAAGADGAPGTLTVFDLPSGPGIRVDTFGYSGFAPSQRFDALLAKLIVHHPSTRFEDVVDRAYRALSECRIAGVATNIGFLQNLLRHPVFRAGAVTTRFVDEHLAELAAHDDGRHRRRYFEPAPSGAGTGVGAGAGQGSGSDAALRRAAGAAHAVDPDCVVAPTRGSVVEISVTVGERVRTGQQVAVLDAMKMEHVVEAPHAGIVREILSERAQVLEPGAPIVRVERDDADDGTRLEADVETPAGAIRTDLQDVIARYARTLDAARPAAVAKRRKTGQRTARENLEDLCDPGTFAEYGALAVAGQRSKLSYDELLDISPADGFIYGLASVNGAHFGPERSRCMVASYDYTVFAGTQGFIGHKKHDRMFQLAESARLPVVVFTEGGGGRPADTDNIGGVNLANPTFWNFGRLSGLVPLIGIASGRCFAGNAALLGLCDVVIATRDASIGMGGPVMIEGAGLGVVKPDEVGPARMHAETGVVDILVDDEAEAVRQAKKYLSYFQGPLADWTCADQARLRDVIPERRTRAYDIRRVLDLLADDDSVLELRPAFGVGIVTALVRIEGRPIGVIANNPKHQAGAIGADESDKLTRFIQLCDAFDLPIVSLCDTPGIMVGTDAERTALVRHASRIFVTASNITVPFFTIVLRKAYGLGAMAMAGGSFHMSSFFTVSWPTGEFGSMGFEGQIRLGYRNELEAIADPVARQKRFQELVDGLYAHGKALNIAPFLSVDAVIDPAESRRWILRGLDAFPPAPRREGRKRPNIDAW
ncbi:MAG TPA: carboxyl transferase domain-containing protein [Quisquiliibacterium sp.]|nr:carboxyl transferase domain-containing protein [Quisquiliibacterium sp.]